MANIDKKPEKRKVDEEMIDRIVKETSEQKTLKEQIYDKINIPIWVLDIIIVVSIAAFVAILIFCRH